MKSRQRAAAGSRWECQASDGVNNRAHPDIAAVHRACVRACAETSAELVTRYVLTKWQAVPVLLLLAHLDGNVDVLECLLEVLLLHPAGDVAQVEGSGGRVDVLVVLAPRLLEPVQTGVGVVFRQASVWLTVFWQLKHNQQFNIQHNSKCGILSWLIQRWTFTMQYIWCCMRVRTTSCSF